MTGALRWIRRSPWYQESDCERYRVSKCLNGTHAIYTAWCKAGDCEWLALICTADLDAARQACEAHTAPHLPGE